MTTQQRKYVKGGVEKKTKKRSALDAGYSESAALTACQNIESNLLKFEMMQALQRKGYYSQSSLKKDKVWT